MLLKNIARIAVKFCIKIIGNALVFGAGGDALIELWELWNKPKQDQRQKVAEIEGLAVASPAEARQLAAEAVAQEAANQPETERQALTDYLSQVPNAIRQSQRRPQDPAAELCPPSCD